MMTERAPVEANTMKPINNVLYNSFDTKDIYIAEESKLHCRRIKLYHKSLSPHTVLNNCDGWICLYFNNTYFSVFSNKFPNFVKKFP